MTAVLVIVVGLGAEAPVTSLLLAIVRVAGGFVSPFKSFFFSKAGFEVAPVGVLLVDAGLEVGVVDFVDVVDFGAALQRTKVGRFHVA